MEVKTHEEQEAIIQKSNDLLTDEELAYKRDYFFGLADWLLQDGVDNVAANNYEIGLSCIKEQERRSGRVTDHGNLERLILDLRGLIPKRKPSQTRRKRKTRKRQTTRRTAAKRSTTSKRTV